MFRRRRRKVRAIDDAPKEAESISLWLKIKLFMKGIKALKILKKARKDGEL